MTAAAADRLATGTEAQRSAAQRSTTRRDEAKAQHGTVQRSAAHHSRRHHPGLDSIPSNSAGLAQAMLEGFAIWRLWQLRGAEGGEQPLGRGSEIQWS